MKRLLATQFTPIYDEREDRLRLIFNINYPTRYDMWVTRNFLVKLIDNLFGFDLNITETEQTTTETTNNTQKEIYPFEKTILLLENMNIKPTPQGYLITFQDNRQIVESELNAKDFDNLIKHILSPVKYKWGIMY